jgi:hypothetical protein
MGSSPPLAQDPESVPVLVVVDLSTGVALCED